MAVYINTIYMNFHTWQGRPRRRRLGVVSVKGGDYYAEHGQKETRAQAPRVPAPARGLPLPRRPPRRGRGAGRGERADPHVRTRHGAEAGVPAAGAVAAPRRPEAGRGHAVTDDRHEAAFRRYLAEAA